MTFTPSATTMVGDELLSFVKKNSGSMSKTELAMATGYTSETKDGKTRCNFAAMQEALIAASGIILGGSSAKVGVGGRKLSFVATVQGNGNLLIGKAYTQKLGLSVGDEFEIKLGKKAIRLVPVGGADEEE